jgi:hypothetical protein
VKKILPNPINTGLRDADSANNAVRKALLEVYKEIESLRKRLEKAEKEIEILKTS